MGRKQEMHKRWTKGRNCTAKRTSIVLIMVIGLSGVQFSLESYK